MSITSQLGRFTAAVRRASARRPALRWLPVVTAAVFLVAATASHERAVDDRRREWGETRSVWVATADLSPGEQAVAERRELPAAAVPDGALDGSVDALDTVLRQRVGRGEVVTDADVVTGTVPAALIPAGWLAVAVGERHGSGAAIGDAVVVVAGGVVLADDAVVVDRLDDGVLVAVPADVAPLVALADETGITLLRTAVAADLTATRSRR